MTGLLEQKENSENRFDCHACVDLRSELLLFSAGEFDVFEFLCKNDCSKNPYFLYFSNFKRHNYTYLQNKRMQRCGVPPPPPIIFERLKLPQQIIYRRKENLSESPNHQKYWKNILVSRFYEQFSRNRRNLGHFRKKFQTLRI